MATLRELIDAEVKKLESDISGLTAKYEAEKASKDAEVAKVKDHLTTFDKWLDTDASETKGVVSLFFSRIGL